MLLHVHLCELSDIRVLPQQQDYCWIIQIIGTLSHNIQLKGIQM